MSATNATDSALLHAIWHVWVEGGEPIGPVSADQLARGIRAGRVPSDASVRRDSDTFWSDLVDVPEIVRALKEVTAESEPPPSHTRSHASPPEARPPSAPPPLAEDAVLQYLVWTAGTKPVGPVSANQIARAIRAGKVPADASVQKIGNLFSSDVLDEPGVIAALKDL